MIPRAESNFDEAEIHRSIAALCRSERGVKAMRDTLAMLDNGGMLLEPYGQECLLNLLIAIFTTYPAARDAMCEAVEDRCEHGVAEGEWCERCNRAMKKARADNGLDPRG